MKVCAIFARAMKLSDNGWRRIRYPFIPVYSIDDATLLKTEFGKKKTFVTFFFFVILLDRTAIDDTQFLFPTELI